MRKAVPKKPAMKKKKKKNLLTMMLIALIVSSIAAIGYMIFFHYEEPVAVKERPVKKKQISESGIAKEKHGPAREKLLKEKARMKEGDREGSRDARLAPPLAKPAAKEKTVVAKIIPPRVPVRRVAIIIDDIGYDMAAVRELMKIDAEITYAVLPGLNHSREAAEALHQGGREILLHLPMEPRSYPKEKPGAGALFTDMSEEEIVLQLKKNLGSVPHAVGVNNHMGSKFMSDEEKLTAVFRQLRHGSLFFIDSRTTPDSKTAAAARKARLTVASRRVFLDNERDYSRIYGILMTVAGTPAGSTPMIVIGHPYPETIRALRDAINVFHEKGIIIVPASQLILKHSTLGAS